MSLSYKALLRISQALSLGDFEWDFGGDVVGSDQYSGWLVVKDAQTEQPVGMLEYSVYEDAYQVDMIGVAPQSRGQGIASMVIQKFLDDEGIQYSDLNWGMLTDDGAALKDKLDAEQGFNGNE